MRPLPFDFGIVRAIVISSLRCYYGHMLGGRISTDDFFGRVIVNWWRYVRVDPDSCWLWSGTRNNKGYGMLTIKRRPSKWNFLAHRISWEAFFGPIPTGMLVLHRCDTPLCVRPDHLFLGTHTDNMRDCHAKGRNGEKTKPGHKARGARHPNSKLTEADVRVIRERCAAGELHREVAKDFGVGRTTVTKIAARFIWAHVE